MKNDRPNVSSQSPMIAGRALVLSALLAKQYQATPNIWIISDQPAAWKTLPALDKQYTIIGVHGPLPKKPVAVIVLDCNLAQPNFKAVPFVKKLRAKAADAVIVMTPYLPDHIDAAMSQEVLMPFAKLEKIFAAIEPSYHLITTENAELGLSLQNLVATAVPFPSLADPIEQVRASANAHIAKLGYFTKPHMLAVAIFPKFDWQDISLPQQQPDLAARLQFFQQITDLLASLAKENEQLSDKSVELQSHLQAIFSSRKWKLMQFTARSKILANKARKNPKKAMQLAQLLIRQGPTGMKDKLHQLVFLADFDEQYREWVKRHTLPDKQLTEQRKQSQAFTYQPRISIITPMYNTPLSFLRACIESVIKQSYENWELCLVDDASPNPSAYELAKQYAKKDRRILVKRRAKNGHISEASNTAVDMTTGEFLALLDHDDILWPNALFEVVKLLNEHHDADFIYSDEDKLEEDGTTHSGPFFKPNWSPDYLRSINYITHFAVVRKSIFERAGRFRKGYEGAQDWDLFLRISEITNEIYHVPTILYSWRKSENSTASEKYAGKIKTYAYTNQQKALLDDVHARGYNGKIESTALAGTWRVRYAIIDNPLVSIIIPTKNQEKFIATCINSILKKTTWKNYEIVLVDTGSTDKPVLDFYKTLAKDKRIKIVNWHKTPFNFSAACNFGAKHAKGEYYLFLNNDTEVVTPDWIEGMLELAQKKETGAVGVRLLYPNDTIQHLGGIMGIPGDENTIGVAGHAFRGKSKNFLHPDRWSIKNYSFVTAACLLINKEKFCAVNGFDESFEIAWNDVDFCLRLTTKLGLFNVVTPHVILIHYESVSVAKPGEKGRDIGKFENEKKRFDEKWHALRVNDPFYNPNLSLKTEAFDQIRL